MCSISYFAPSGTDRRLRGRILTRSPRRCVLRGAIRSRESLVYPTALRTELDEVVRQHEAFEPTRRPLQRCCSAPGSAPSSSRRRRTSTTSTATSISSLATMAGGPRSTPSTHGRYGVPHIPSSEQAPAAPRQRAVRPSPSVRCVVRRPVIPTARLRARARPAIDGDWLVPNQSDELRITLAHALFQNLGIDLSELLTIRALSEGAAVADAHREAAARDGDAASIWRGTRPTTRCVVWIAGARSSPRPPADDAQHPRGGLARFRSLYGRGLHRAALP